MIKVFWQIISHYNIMFACLACFKTTCSDFTHTLLMQPCPLNTLYLSANNKYLLITYNEWMMRIKSYMLVYENLYSLYLYTMAVYLWTRKMTHKQTKLCISTVQLTGGEDYRAGWVARSGIIGGSDLDNVFLSTLGRRQGAGGGCRVTSEVLVTCHQVLDGSIHPLVEIPGHRESGHIITYHYRHADRGWRWRSCLKTQHKDAAKDAWNILQHIQQPFRKILSISHEQEWFYS